MVTILEVDLCSQTEAAKIFNTIDMDLLICEQYVLFIFEFEFKLGSMNNAHAHVAAV